MAGEPRVVIQLFEPSFPGLASRNRAGQTWWELPPQHAGLEACFAWTVGCDGLTVHAQLYLIT